MNYKFLQPLQNIILKETLLPEYHEDYIEKVPKGFHLLGKSESCKI